MDWGLAKIFRRLADGQIPETQSTDTGTHTVSEMQEPKPQEISGMTGHGTVMGTPGYMSPEQARGESSQVDERSDVFSLGKVLQFLVTLNPSSADLSPAKPLVAIFTRAAATSPAARYSSVADLAADVSRYLDGQPVSAYRERLVDRVARFYRRYNVAILLITVYLLTRVALLLIWHH
jgi:serine/threonine protein kinase